MTGPRLVKGASVADFATHLGGFGAHGAAISAGLRSVVPPKGSQNGSKRLQQRSMEREGENDQVRSENRSKNLAGRKAPTAFLLRNLRRFSRDTGLQRKIQNRSQNRCAKAENGAQFRPGNASWKAQGSLKQHDGGRNGGGKPTKLTKGEKSGGLGRARN